MCGRYRGGAAAIGVSVHWRFRRRVGGTGAGHVQGAEIRGNPGQHADDRARSVRRSPRLALHTQSRQRRDDSIDDRGLAVVSFDRSRFCVKRVSYAELRSEDPCLRAIDAMSQDFLERTRENSSAFSQSIAIPSKSTRWSSAFLAAGARVAAEDATRTPRAGARPDDWDRLRPRCRRETSGASMRAILCRRDARTLRIHFDRSKRLRALLENIHPGTGAS